MLAFVKSVKAIHLVDAMIILATIGAVVYGVSQRLSFDDATCKVVGTIHQLTLKDDAFSQDKLSVRRCDTIQVANRDTAQYSLNFGTHENIIPYPGFVPQVISQNESITFDALATGTYLLHDHLRNQAVVELTVTPID